MLSFQQKKYEYTKKQESTAHSQDKENKLTETVLEETQTVDLPDKDFKSTNLIMLRQLKETRRMMSQQIGNINTQKI